MRCVLYHSIQHEVVGRNFTQNKKGLVMYNKDHGTIVMSRHVASKHYAMLKQFSTWQTTTTTTTTIRQTSNKWKKQPPLSISSTLECYTKIQTLLKICFLRIWSCTSLKVINNLFPLRICGWEGLCFINVAKLPFLVDNNLVTK